MAQAENRGEQPHQQRIQKMIVRRRRPMRGVGPRDPDQIGIRLVDGDRLQTGARDHPKQGKDRRRAQNKLSRGPSHVLVGGASRPAQADGTGRSIPKTRDPAIPLHSDFRFPVRRSLAAAGMFFCGDSQGWATGFQMMGIRAAFPA